MNLFIALLLIPLSFAGVTAPDCRGLASIIQDYEKDLSRAFVQTPQCSTLKVEDIVKTTVPLQDKNFLEGKLCHSLSAVDAELETLKLEEAILTGIKKLKTTVETAKAETASKDPAKARAAGKTFVGSLNTAQSLELLINSVSASDKKPLIQKLQEVPEDKRADLKTFTSTLVELCKQNEAKITDACNPAIFTPTEETVKEINALLKATPPQNAQIGKWRSMLAIKKKNAKPDDAKYSFNDMRNEMEGAFAKIDNNDTLSKEHLVSIQKLSDFENDPGLPFVDDIHKVKDTQKTKVAVDRFSWLIQDAQRRQQYEVQSKMSLAWLEVSPSVTSLTDQQRNDCALAKSDYSKAVLCQDHLNEAKEKMNGPERAYLESILPTLNTSIKYENALSKDNVLCMNEVKKTGTISEECYGKVHNQLGLVQEKILQLNFLKEKIGSENQDLMKLRNFALLKWGTQKCEQVDASVDFCEPNLTLSKEAFLTVSDAMNISILFAPKPEAEEKMKEICSQEGRKKKTVESLCAFFNPANSQENIVRAKELQKLKDEQKAPTTVEDTGRREEEIKDNWMNTGLNAFNQVFQGAMANNYYRNANPYQYNYNPYQINTTGLSPSDTLLFNARYYGGYGFYMPTPGYQAYTTFGARNALSPYTGISSYSSMYFSN